MLRENPATARLGYETASRIVTDAGYKVEDVKLTQSDLILERIVTATATIIEFPVLDTQQGATGIAFNTEKRLKLQDAFIASSVGVFMCAPSSSTDTTFIPQTYPNDQVFSGVGVAAALNSIYNGNLVVTMNGTVLVPYWSLQKHRWTPQTQQNATVTAAQVDNSESGFLPIEPNLIFQGTKNMLVQAIFPVAPAAVQSANQRIRIHYRGYLAQNATLLK